MIGKFVIGRLALGRDAANTPFAAIVVDVRGDRIRIRPLDTIMDNIGDKPNRKWRWVVADKLIEEPPSLYDFNDGIKDPDDIGTSR